MENIVLNETEETIWEMAVPYLSVMENELHTREVIDFAHHLLLSENGDRGVVIPAAILHDVGWSQLSEEVHAKARVPKGDIKLIRLHEKAGVKIAREILTSVHNDSSMVDEILMIIDGHDTKETAISKNDRIMRDADKLSRYSSFCWKRYKQLRSIFYIDRNDFLDFLEEKIKQWLYFSKSKEIAREELIKRRQEASTLPNFITTGEN